MTDVSRIAERGSTVVVDDAADSEKRGTCEIFEAYEHVGEVGQVLRKAYVFLGDLPLSEIMGESLWASFQELVASDDDELTVDHFDA